jgi:hypothetical protein
MHFAEHAGFLDKFARLLEFENDSIPTNFSTKKGARRKFNEEECDPLKTYLIDFNYFIDVIKKQTMHCQFLYQLQVQHIIDN